MSGETLEFAGHKVLGYDTACAFHTVLVLYEHEVVHLVAVVALHLSGLYLTVERRVCAEQKLLACLTLGVECTAHLGATERTVGEKTAVFACERHTLSHTLVDDIVGHFGETIYVCLACAVVTALHCVVEKTVYGVTVVLIVLGCVYTALGCDRVSAARAVLDAEVEHVEAHLGESRGCRRTGETRADHYDVETTLVCGIDKFLMGLVVGPFLSDRTLRDLRVRRIHYSYFAVCSFHIAY